MHRRDLLLSLGGTLATGRLLGHSVEELWRLGAGINSELARAAPLSAGPLGPFSARENELVLTIAEHILPRTDTPGAHDARVNEFIAVIVDEWYDDDDRARFLEGRAKESTSRVFWAGMKSHTLYGYFTSELVQTEVLKSPISPGRYDGCVALTPP